MKQLRPNNMLFIVSMRVLSLFFFTWSFCLLLAGHNNPGGGFIGGLMTATAVLVLYLVFDMTTIAKAIPISFTTMIGVGLLLAAFTGIISIIFGYPFLTQFFEYFQIPMFGEVELTTALIFDLGVYLVVVVAALTIILAMAEDDN